MTTKRVACAVRLDAPDGAATVATGTIAAECLGADGDGSACLSLVITGPRGKVTALLNGEETRRLRAQVDEVLR